VPIGDPRRGPYLRWLFFGAGCLEPAILDRMLERAPGPAHSEGYGDFEQTLDVVAQAIATGPYLLGAPFTAADVLIGSQLRFGMMMQAVPKRPEIERYVERLGQRPALQRATAKDAELAAVPPAG
jgi:glutathione S-transferase